MGDGGRALCFLVEGKVMHTGKTLLIVLSSSSVLPLLQVSKKSSSVFCHNLAPLVLSWFVSYPSALSLISLKYYFRVSRSESPPGGGDLCLGGDGTLIFPAFQTTCFTLFYPHHNLQNKKDISLPPSLPLFLSFLSPLLIFAVLKIDIPQPSFFF